MAGEVSYLMKSPRSLLMGDTAVSQFDNPLGFFYNPATREDTNEVRITPFSFTLQLLNPFTYLSDIDPLPEDEFEIARRFMNIPVHLGMGFVPIVQLGSMTATYFFSTKNDLTLSNANHPMMYVDLSIAKGIVLNYTSSFKYKLGTLHVGVNLKAYKQSGVKRSYYLFGQRLQDLVNGLEDEAFTNLISSEFFENVLDFSTSTVLNFDVGVIQKVLHNENREVALGVVVNDIINRNLSNRGLQSFVPSSTGRIGLSYKENLASFSYTLAADYAAIGADIPKSRKIHLGANLDFGRTKLFTGMNEGYLTYGMELTLWPLRLILGSYGVEKGVLFRQYRASRFAFYLELFDCNLNV
jgi:hypothetical protein